MAVHQVITAPDELLKKKAVPVENINAGVLRLMDNMRDTLYAADGVGLAAPQIGVSKRMIVVDPGDNLLELINPVIIRAEGEQIGREGCLSVPGIIGLVKRAESVSVQALNRQGEEVTIGATGILARVLQHEIDHLDGFLITDRAIETRKERR